ncbi:MAG: TetR family transcriptional regulator [Actinomycetota bacterium]
MTRNPPTTTSGDRRVRRTKALLSEALLELLVTKRWDKISVQDIIDRADVGRSTFYAHYATKVELLLDHLPGLVRQLADPVDADHDAMPNLVPLFEHIDEMQAVIRPILQQTIRGEVTDALQTQFEADWTAVLQRHRVEHPMAAAFLAGATVAAGRWYLDHVDEVTPEQAAAGLTELARGVIEAVANGAR